MRLIKLSIALGRLEDLQAQRDGEIHQLGTGIDEEIDERQMALGGESTWSDRSTVRDSRFMAARFRPRLVTTRLPRQ